MKKGLLGKIFNIILWIVLGCWVVLFVVDFIRSSQNKTPLICLNKTSIKTGTGTADVCLSFGYKTVHYHCATAGGKNYEGTTEFGPFWKDSICDIEK